MRWLGVVALVLCACAVPIYGQMGSYYQRKWMPIFGEHGRQPFRTQTVIERLQPLQDEPQVKNIERLQPPPDQPHAPRALVSSVTPSSVTPSSVTPSSVTPSSVSPSSSISPSTSQTVTIPTTIKPTEATTTSAPKKKKAGDTTQTLKDVEKYADTILEQLQALQNESQKMTSVRLQTTSEPTRPLNLRASMLIDIEDSNMKIASNLLTTALPSDELKEYVGRVEHLIAEEVKGNVYEDDVANMINYAKKIKGIIDNKKPELIKYYRKHPEEIESLTTNVKKSKADLSTTITEQTNAADQKKLLVIVGSCLGAALLLAVVAGAVGVWWYRRRANTQGDELRKMNEEASKEDEPKTTQAPQKSIMAGKSNPAFAEENESHRESNRHHVRDRSPEARAPIREYSSEVRAPRREYSSEVRAPRREYSPEVRASRREYSPEVRAPRRDYSPEVRAPRREYSPEVRAPRREYSPEVRAPRREYSHEVGSPLQGYSEYSGSGREERDYSRREKAPTHAERYPVIESKPSRRMHESGLLPRQPKGEHPHQSRSAYYDYEERADSPPLKSWYQDKLSRQDKPKALPKPQGYMAEQEAPLPKMHQVQNRFGHVQPTKHQFINPVNERREFRGPYGPDDI